MFRYLNILAVCLLCSCGNLQELQLAGVKGFTVNQISTAGIDGDLLLTIRNPNRMAFTVFPSEFGITYSGVDLGKAKLTKKVRIRRNTEETYTFNVKSDFQNINLSDVMKILQGSSFKSELGVKGELKAGRFLYRRKVPVDFKEKISLR